MSGAGLLPYHFGRLTTYAGLGGVSGGLAGMAADFVSLRWIFAAALTLAAAYCVVVIARSLGWIVPRNARPFGGVDRILDTIGWSRVVNRASRLGGYSLGLALGFLPCGLVYAALAAAAGTGSAMSGAVAMAAFTGATRSDPFGKMNPRGSDWRGSSMVSIWSAFSPM